MLFQQSGRWLPFYLHWISIVSENKREELSGIFYQPRDALYTQLCVCVCVITRRGGYWTVKFKGPTLISLLCWLLVCIQTCDSPRGSVGEGVSPRRCQVPDLEQMLTNRNTNPPEGLCVSVVSLSLSLARSCSLTWRRADFELRWSRTSSCGHLLVHESSQKTDKPKLLLIQQLRCKWRLSLMPKHLPPSDCANTGSSSFLFFCLSYSAAQTFPPSLSFSLYCSRLSS